ncbi:MAG: hypothetical protein J6W82_03465 [Bacteroidales bacterium]|nr:hypothetical protein [Bacteroidales bacterium]
MRNLILGFVTMLLLGATKVDEKEVALGTQSVNFASLTGNTEYTITVQGNAVTGAKAYEASAVASINLTPDGIHIEDITAAGSYAVEGLSVMAVNGKNILASGATGSILIFAASNHGFVVNDVINVNGSVIDYNGVWEFTGPTITKTGTATVTYPEPVEYDAAKIDAYADAPVIEYATATGVADSDARTLTVASGKVLNVYGSLAAVDGRTVSINGYAFGYNNSKVNFMLVGTPTIDQSVPYLGTNPDNGQTIQWDNDKYGTANAQTITVSLNSAASGYTVSFTDTANAWTVSDDTNGTITVYPKAANTSTTDDKTLTITIAHKDNSDLTSVITLSQKKGTSSGTDVVVLSEDFSEITAGNSTETGGSGTAWSGNTNFPTVDAAYQAGGAVKLGKSGAPGSITSKSLNLSKAFTVSIDVKGWSSVEGKIKVTVGGTTKEITYTETMSGSFGTYEVNFDAATSSSTVKIQTSAKRAFIDNVVVTRHD